jgi:hypothetical protein
MKWAAFFASLVGLGMLEAVLASRQGASNIGAAENGLVALLQKFFDPATPAFSATTVAAAGGSTSSSSGSSKSGSGSKSDTGGGLGVPDPLPYLSPVIPLLSNQASQS